MSRFPHFGGRKRQEVSRGIEVPASWDGQWLEAILDDGTVHEFTVESDRWFVDQTDGLHTKYSSLSVGMAVNGRVVEKLYRDSNDRMLGFR